MAICALSSSLLLKILPHFLHLYECLCVFRPAVGSPGMGMFWGGLPGWSGGVGIGGKLAILGVLTVSPITENKSVPFIS